MDLLTYIEVVFDENLHAERPALERMTTQNVQWDQGEFHASAKPGCQEGLEDLEEHQVLARLDALEDLHVFCCLQKQKELAS